MLDIASARSVRLVGWLLILGLIPAIAAAQTTPQPSFVVPRDRAAWDAQRPAIERERSNRPQPGQPGSISVQVGQPGPLPTHPNVTAEPVTMTMTYFNNPPIIGQFLRPAHSGRLPLVILLVDPSPAEALATTPGWDGRPPALVLVEMGFAVLVLGDHQFHNPIAYDAPLRSALDVLLARPDVDPTRVAVLGLGQTGLTALGLMGHDPRVTCGVAAIESRSALSTKAIAYPAGTSEASQGGVGTLSTRYEELAALCAPRPLCLMIGEPLPLPPSAKSAGKLLERAAKGTYKVYGKEGSLSFTHFGEFGDQTSVSTRLQWLAGLEWLDKHFRSQGPTPLGHLAEPEPLLDPADKEVMNLTEHGIAGWAPEMSGRDSTWTWRDGVVLCRPRGNEYGWLRAPVAVADFLLQVEWQVPPHGNAGIFMRAQPVTWFLPPTEENKLRVSTLGLTWPSRTGLELQTQDDPGNADRYSTGSLYRHAAPASNPTHSPDQWNRSTVRARGTRIEVWNNGTQVLDADLTRSADTLPSPPLAGYIGLQNHNAPADYRNVRLKRLTSEPQPAPTSIQRASTDGSAGAS